jgi:hypothetical protein
MQLVKIILKNTVSVVRNPLMAREELIDVYSENCMKEINTLFWQNAASFNVRPGGSYSINLAKKVAQLSNAFHVLYFLSLSSFPVLPPLIFRSLFSHLFISFLIFACILWVISLFVICLDAREDVTGASEFRHQVLLGSLNEDLMGWVCSKEEWKEKRCKVFIGYPEGKNYM